MLANNLILIHDFGIPHLLYFKIIFAKKRILNLNIFKILSKYINNHKFIKSKHASSKTLLITYFVNSIKT